MYVRTAAAVQPPFRADRAAGGNESLPRATLNFDKIGRGNGVSEQQEDRGRHDRKGNSSPRVLVANIHRLSGRPLATDRNAGCTTRVLFVADRPRYIRSNLTGSRDV